MVLSLDLEVEEQVKETACLGSEAYEKVWHV